MTSRSWKTGNVTYDVRLAASFDIMTSHTNKRSSFFAHGLHRMCLFWEFIMLRVRIRFIFEALLIVKNENLMPSPINVQNTLLLRGRTRLVQMI